MLRVQARLGVWLVVLLLGLGAGTPDGRGDAARPGRHLLDVPAVGLRVRAPPGWHVTGRSLLDLVSPRPVLAVADFSLAGLSGEAGDSPHAALRRRGSQGALLVLLEERDEHFLNCFPARPRAFRLHLSGTGCYGRRGEELTFRSNGRSFYAFVSLGAAAPPASMRALEATLDSLHVGTRHLHPLAFRDRKSGLAFAYPALWSATRTRLDAITSPPQLVAVASYPLAVAPSKDSCPLPALARRPADGVLVQLREEINPRVARSFPARPKHFALPRLGRVECYGPRSARIRFRDAGRGFYAAISFGLRSTASTRRATLRLLDGLHISPS